MESHPKYGAVLITGASSGIGRATALHLERLGFNVFATVRNKSDAEGLQSETDGNLLPVLMDVTDQDSIDQAKEQVSQAVGEAGLAGLVNNAGVGFLAPLEFVPLDELRWLYDVNIFGLLAVTQAFLPLLRQRRGRIVNISSTASIVVAPFHGPYSSSKFAVNALSDALRLELKPLGVQVSVVVCGSIRTPMWEKGRHLSERVENKFPQQALHLYGGPYRRLRDYFFSGIGKSGVPPEEAALKIGRALTDKHAKNTYYVGPDANLYKLADKFIGGRLRDWVIYTISVGKVESNQK
jgi:NAD(P)-dependent dehydrogenase (short-subunit alcohol dehydrogenase family)